MGIFKSITNALAPLAKATGLDKVTGLVEKSLSFVNRIAAPITEPLTKLVDRLPLPNVVKDFANNFLQNPAALLTAAALGPVGAFIQGALPAQLAPLASILGATPAANGAGLENIALMFAKQQAEDVLVREATERLEDIAA